MLPHHKLLATVNEAWHRAIEYEAIKIGQASQNLGLRQDHEGKCFFTSMDDTEGEGWTQQKYMELMAFLITENHIWNGKDLRRQVVGIPMGSPVSPHLANLYRYVVEAQFVEELLSTGKRQEAEACEYTFGYIDDLCTF